MPSLVNFNNVVTTIAYDRLYSSQSGRNARTSSKLYPLNCQTFLLYSSLFSNLDCVSAVKHLRCVGESVKIITLFGVTKIRDSMSNNRHVE